MAGHRIQVLEHTHCLEFPFLDLIRSEYRVEPLGAVHDRVLAGYYTLSAYRVRLGELPEAIAKSLPHYPLLPATLLGRLAVSTSRRGQHLGRFLLMDALYRTWKNTSQVASVGVMVDALDENAHAFYIRHEFRRSLGRRGASICQPSGIGGRYLRNNPG
ncbi:MAG TPA: hypothetical protein VLY24_15745 [Bryobacteraceae bacterium]|nr:hypothetical protein [Bryobacteraceae bacterium]